MAEHTVEVGWLGLWLANGSSGDFGWGSAIGSSYRFPDEGLPYHPCPERSPFFSHPQDTLLPLSLSLSAYPFPPFSTYSSSLTPQPPSPPFISTQLSVVQHSTPGGGLQRFSLSLSKKHTHINTHIEAPQVHTCVYLCAYAQFAKTVFPV